MITHPGLTEEERINLYKLIVANSDIADALFSTRFFIENIKDIKDDGFLTLQSNVISAYGRPFKTSYPHGPLDKNKWPNYQSEEDIKIHEMILEQRDKIVAHSDSKFRKVEIIPPGASPISKNNKEIAFSISTRKLEIETFKKIESMCLDLGNRLFNEINKEIKRMYGDMNLPNKPFDLI